MSQWNRKVRDVCGSAGNVTLDMINMGSLFSQDTELAQVQKLLDKGRPENQEEVRSFLQAAQFNADQ